MGRDGALSAAGALEQILAEVLWAVPALGINSL